MQIVYYREGYYGVMYGLSSVAVFKDGKTYYHNKERKINTWLELKRLTDRIARREKWKRMMMC